MKKNPFISRLATSVAAVALTIGMAFTFSACSDDDEVVDPATTEPSRLSVPTVNEVAEADITTSSLKFSWAAVEGASSYSAQIRLSEAGDIYRERIVEDVTEVTFENLNDNTDYYFRVRANHKQNESRNSAYSEYKMVKTVAADPTIPQLAVPANVMCDKSKTTETELTFMWDAVENATAGYAVTLTSIGKDDVTATTTATTYTFTGLEKGRQYFFTVRACEVKEGDKVTYTASKNSGAVKATTIGQLDTPQNLKSQDKMSQAVRFVWDAVPNAKDYYYELQTLTVTGSSTVEEGLMTELSADIVPGQTVHATATTNTSMTFFGLEKATYYSFRVKAVSGNDAYQDSDFTDYCVIKTLEYDPTPLVTPKYTVKEAQQLKVIFEWKEVVVDETEVGVGAVAGYDIQFALVGTEVADDDKDYTIELPAIDETTSQPLLEYAVSEYGPAGTEGRMAVEPEKTYKVRMRTRADETNPKVSNSSWTEWKEVTTPALAKELTIKPADGTLADAIARMVEGGTLTLSAGTYDSSVRDSKGNMSTIELKKSVIIKGESAKITCNTTLFKMTGNFDVFVLDGVEIIGESKVNDKGDTVYPSYVIGIDSNAKHELGKLTVKNTTIEHYGRSLYRNQGNGAIVKEIEVDNCVFRNIQESGQNYALFNFQNVAAPEIAPSVSITNSTFDNCHTILATSKLDGKGDSGTTEISIDKCTFYNMNTSGQSGRRLIDATNGKSNMTATVKFDNSVISITAGSKYNGVRATTVTSTNSFLTNDAAFNSNAIPNITSLDKAAADVFTDPTNGNFKLLDGDVKTAGAGDPRWLK